MATEFSFDVVSRVDMMEVRNAVDQAQKELMHRYDLKGAHCEIEFEKEQITLHAGDEGKLKQVQDILFSKFIKRGLDARQIDYDKMEPATGLSVRQKVILKSGIPQEAGKAVCKKVRDSGIKVNAQIQGEQIRVSGKSKDDLQKAIQFIKALELEFPVEVTNFR